MLTLGGLHSTMDSVFALHPVAPGFDSRHSQEIFSPRILLLTLLRFIDGTSLLSQWTVDKHNT